MRKIIHVDMDAFYAAVEQRDDADLRGKPIAVGGSGGRGVVMTASYEARRFGVRSAMPSMRARRLCPDLIFVRARFDAYKEASRQIRTIFHSYTPQVEPLSLDEAYLDVTEPLRGPASATGIARAIKAEIVEATGLTASAGVSFNKFLAKLASDLDKPDGLSIIRPDDAMAFLASLPIERFFGVGPATARKLKAAGIHHGADLLQRGEEDMAVRFGKSGRYYWNMAQGLDDRPVQPHRRRKSLGAERTFGEDIADVARMLVELRLIADTVANRLEVAAYGGRTITLKFRYPDFETHTRRRTLTRPVRGADTLIEVGTSLLTMPRPPLRPVRLLGLTVSNAAEEAEDDGQLELAL